MFSLLFSHFLHMYYMAVDTILYIYALPIDFIPHSYLSLCLSYNLSQA